MICVMSQSCLNMFFFADDTNIFKSGDNLVELCEVLSTELKLLSKWFNVNKLLLNVSKTHFMVFGKRKKLIM